MANKARVLIDCMDAKGLVYRFSKVFFDRDLNVDNNREFVDKERGKFFMRSVVTGDFDIDELYNELVAVAPLDAHVRVIEPKPKKIVILVTKESHCLGDILIRWVAGQLEADIEAVVSNRENLRDLTRRFDIPFLYVPSDTIERADHEEQILDILKGLDFDYIVLAKYMRILSADFVHQFPKQIINIHHSFLPAFIGANPYKQAHERGVKIIGATAHFVTTDLDEGPIISQDVIPVNHRLEWKDMQRAGQDVEKIVLARALSFVLNDRVFVNENKTIVF